MFNVKLVLLIACVVTIVHSFPYDEQELNAGKVLVRTRRSNCGDGLSCTQNARCSKTEYGYFCETRSGENMCVMSKYGHTCGKQCGCTSGGCFCGNKCFCNNSGGCQCTI